MASFAEKRKSLGYQKDGTWDAGTRHGRNCFVSKSEFIASFMLFSAAFELLYCSYSSSRCTKKNVKHRARIISPKVPLFPCRRSTFYCRFRSIRFVTGTRDSTVPRSSPWLFETEDAPSFFLEKGEYIKLAQYIPKFCIQHPEKQKITPSNLQTPGHRCRRPQLRSPSPEISAKVEEDPPPISPRDSKTLW